jgi:hypothetical protein
MDGPGFGIENRHVTQSCKKTLLALEMGGLPEPLPAEAWRLPLCEPSHESVRFHRPLVSMSTLII